MPLNISLPNKFPDTESRFIQYLTPMLPGVFVTDAVPADLDPANTPTLVVNSVGSGQQPSSGNMSWHLGLIWTVAFTVLMAERDHAMNLCGQVTTHVLDQSVILATKTQNHQLMQAPLVVPTTLVEHSEISQVQALVAFVTRG